MTIPFKKIPVTKMPVQKKKQTAKNKTAQASRKASPTRAQRATGTGARAHSIQPDLAVARRVVLDLLGIQGVSGHEKEVADRICQWLLEAGCPKSSISFDSAHTRTPLKGNVGNLIVKLPGTLPGLQSAPRRLLMAHMDTVPVCVGAKPVVVGRYIKSEDPTTGLGADDRAGVAVVLSTAIQILRSNLPHPPLTFFFAIQEEVGLWGARFARASDLGKPQLAFNFDGGAVEKITIGATGGYRLDIAIEGIPSHAGVSPEKGVSAVS
ncbi:MAG: M20/M25/M40 family metallo-hydrolase, partial [Planctomycetota bacterium]